MFLLKNHQKQEKESIENENKIIWGQICEYQKWCFPNLTAKQPLMRARKINKVLFESNLDSEGMVVVTLSQRCHISRALLRR